MHFEKTFYVAQINTKFTMYINCFLYVDERKKERNQMLYLKNGEN